MSFIQLQLGLKLITSVKQIERKINSSAIEHVYSRLNRLPAKISVRAKDLIRSTLNQSSAATSLISGRLREEMGIVDASSELQQIFQAITQTVNVTISPPSTRGMKIRLTAVPFNLDSIIGGAGSYVTDNGAVIPWFQWLTAAGDRIIVRDYDVEGGHSARSRTGDMIMRKGKKGWRVPPEFAGSPGNNFVTRATDLILPELGNYIQNTVKSML
jgi:hypothetical protein